MMKETVSVYVPTITLASGDMLLGLCPVDSGCQIHGHHKRTIDGVPMYSCNLRIMVTVLTGKVTKSQRNYSVQFNLRVQATSL